ncbi:MAG: hypothetical protein HY537_00935 [Deltaproteobacteria bacterium]|nr:hypothetical protein [Deltaproteobacteria bacterium]
MQLRTGFALLFLLLALFEGRGLFALSELDFSQKEENQVLQQMQQFYAPQLSAQQMRSQMNRQRSLSVLALDGKPLDQLSEKELQKLFPKAAALRMGKGQNDNPLEELAQAKSSKKFRIAECLLSAQKRQSLGIDAANKDDIARQCEQYEKDPKGKAAPEGNDRVTNLLHSYNNDITEDDKNFFRLSTLKKHKSAKTKKPQWPDDYWPTQQLGTARRWQKNFYGETYSKALKEFETFQPKEWLAILKKLTPSPSDEVALWSPAEKYDALMVDPELTLAFQQARSGKAYAENGDIPTWFGICHGWAPASYMVPAPMKDVTVKNAKGLEIKFLAHDIRALTSLIWANGVEGLVDKNGRFEQKRTNFVGGRCNSKDTETYDNGRLKQQDCFDTNPRTLLFALAYFIGEQGLSFTEDRTFHAEVWNQGIRSYSLKFFKPGAPSKLYDNPAQAVVSYNKSFKKNDRFQKPLTRGNREGNKFDDSDISHIVGVVAKVNYTAEVKPQPDAVEENVLSDTFTMDLELEKDGNDYVVLGGEWHHNAHPDFLWVPQKGVVAANPNMDIQASDLTISKTAGVKGVDTSVVQKASEQGTPLCPVVRWLVEQSSGVKTVFRCPGQTS